MPTTPGSASITVQAETVDLVRHRKDHNQTMEWREFPEGEEPVVLTAISSLCNDGKHDQCPGHAESEEHGGEIVFCVCSCHRAAPVA